VRSPGSLQSLASSRRESRAPCQHPRRTQALEPTANSVRCAPAAGGAEAAWRQAAGAASCLAFPACHQRRISRRVTPGTDHRAIDRPPAPLFLPLRLPHALCQGSRGAIGTSSG
jgi:hypothetical protein